jgi:hypothetical protein
VSCDWARSSTDLELALPGMFEGDLAKALILDESIESLKARL